HTKEDSVTPLSSPQTAFASIGKWMWHQFRDSRIVAFDSYFAFGFREMTDAKSHVGETLGILGRRISSRA
ncbi:MAG: hypothetical protein VX035_09490, partial [Planctomycetota bacterium]|nr:hypothetical protein [Planctomycetota bacterium]